MADWQRETSADKKDKILLFFISPFLSFLYSLKRVNTKSSFIVFYLFALFFGMSFSVDIVQGNNKTIDGMSYRTKFVRQLNITETQFVENFDKYITFESEKKDFYFDTVAYFVSRVTTNYHVMFLIFAAVFAFFQLKSIKIFTSCKEFDNSFFSLILLFIFTFNTIFNINGVRFWTAGWIGVYCIFNIFLKGDKRYLLLLLCTPFIHASYWFFIAVIVIAILLKRFDKAWYLLFILSFIFSSIAVDILSLTSDFLPSAVGRMVEIYTSDEVIAKNAKAGTGYWLIGKYWTLAAKVYINILIFIIMLRVNVIKKDKSAYNLYKFMLVYVTIMNFVMFVPSLGVRFFLLVYPLVAYLLLVFFKEFKISKYWVYSIPIVFLLPISSMIYLYLEVVNIPFFFTNPFTLIYKYLIIAQ